MEIKRQRCRRRRRIIKDTRKQRLSYSIPIGMNKENLSRELITKMDSDVSKRRSVDFFPLNFRHIRYFIAEDKN